MNVSEAITSFLKTVGIKTFFGVSGVPNLFLLNTLEREGIKFIQNIHENNSIYFAAGNYLNSGKINFVFVTSGPGITNCITAVGNAYIDNIPMVIISINNNTFDYGLGNHHDSSPSSGIDTVGLMKACTCYSDMITSANNSIGLITKAYYAALKNNKPAHVSIPANLLNSEINFNSNYKIIDNSNFVENQFGIEETNDLESKINGFNKPLFIFADAEDKRNEIKKFIETNSFYYCLTSSNKGLYSQKTFLGYIDYIDQLKINKTIDLFDEIVLVGNGFNNFFLENIYNFIYNKKIIHFSDSEGTPLFGIFPLYEYKCIHNFDAFLSLNLRPFYANFLEPINNRINVNIKNKYIGNIYYDFLSFFNTYIKPNESVFISIGTVMEYGLKFFRPINENVNIFYTGNFFALGNSVMSLGYSLNNHNRTYVLLGDGDFLMNWNEIITAVHNNINITLILFNNGGYKSLKKPFEKAYSIKSVNNNFYNSINIGFKGVANEFGLNYKKIENYYQLKEEFAHLPENGVNLIEIKV